MTLASRFWLKIEQPANGAACWLWTASLSNRGYGKIGAGSRAKGWVPAHRVSYELRHGSIPDDLFVLHKCDNPRCVNPDHLFLGTQTDNMRDASRKGRTKSPFAGITHCKRGHEFTPENTRAVTAPGGGPGRQCKACERARREPLSTLTMRIS